MASTTVNVNPNSYPRPGIYIQEINNSQVTPSPVQQGIVNFVPGFSRTGVTFNRPVLLRSISDCNAVFGPIDRFLERKGSFFHRTLQTAVQSGPVWGMSLLNTTTADTLDYVSLSLAPLYDNTSVLSSTYSSFFDKSGFWKRDTTSFLDVAGDATRLLHFYNGSAQAITVFVFKSSLAGFDITASVWYGSIDQVPSYIYPTDYISDYLVEVVVVAGDWSNYKTLGTDPHWSAYFNADGLRTTQVQAFLNDKNVNKLADWNVSLIPYFRDQNNNNMFIETIINQSTDLTGLYCAFDIEAFETDYPTGLVDLIGNTLVGNETAQSIDMISYNDTIIDTDIYTQVVLNTLGNVAGVGTPFSGRTTSMSDGTLSGLTITNLTGNTESSSTTPTFVVASASGYGIFAGQEVAVAGGTLSMTAFTASTVSGHSIYRIDTFYIDSTGALNLLAGTVTTDVTSGYNTVALSTAVKPNGLPNNAIVMGYVLREMPHTGSPVTTYFPVSLVSGGYNPLVMGTSGTDIVVGATANNILNMTFVGTATATVGNYEVWRRYNFFSSIVAGHSMSQSVIVDVNGLKVSFANVTWTDNSTSTGVDKNIQITAPTGTNIYTAAAGTVSPAVNGSFAIYFVDNEFIVGLNGMSTTTAQATTNNGVVAQFSQMYIDFYNGQVSSGNYFYQEMASIAVRFLLNTDGYDYVIFETASLTGQMAGIISGSKLWVTGSVSANNGLFTVTQNGVTTLLNNLSVNVLSGETAYRVSQAVVTAAYETDTIFNYAKVHYLKMYNVNAVLNVIFMDSAPLTNAFPLDTLTNNTGLNIYSEGDGFVISVDIIVPTGYVIQDNKLLIDATRYPEIVIGNYFAAYVNPATLEAGEVGKNLTRIISKTYWSGNTGGTNYAEITTDAKILLTNYGTSIAPILQTTRYTTIDDYVTTYKAIVLSPFKVRTASYPDGTDTTQSTILSTIGNSTTLFTAITNKDTFQWRYLIDSFGLGLINSSKQELADICGARLNCIGFLNMPSMTTGFAKSSNPTFTNPDGTLNFTYIQSGGNTNGNPSFLYSFAGPGPTGNSQACVGYFTPYVVVNDNGRPLNFPPASLVANTYMLKQNSRVSGIYPWTIAAGIENGVISNIADLEYDFADSPDINILNGMGANPIIYRSGQFYIDTENTAATTPLSSLSFLHCREVLIELENALYQLLLPYQWKFNIATVRAEIQRKANTICQSYVDQGALYTYSNEIDDTNNTPTIIDNQMGLLQTTIQIVKGMGVLINSITINGTGANVTTSSTGFNPVTTLA